MQIYDLIPYYSRTYEIEMNEIILERAGAVAMNRIFGFHPKISVHIIRELGSCSALFGLDGAELDKLFGPYSKFRPLVNGRAIKDALAELRRLENLGYRVISINEDAYPSLLKECEDAPSCLYIRSSSPPEEIFNCRETISIVGTRDISLYGKEWCTRIVRSISESPEKPAIVSGLALGTDITAHLAALDFGLPTVAVIPVGIEDIYPPSHRVAACRIAASPGCAIISDYPPGTAPMQVNFIRRNRIIAGLGRSTILIESKSKGGGMITAHLAESYGREVFALPGRIDDTRSQGCNALIARKIAEPIYSLASLCDALGLKSTRSALSKDPAGAVRMKYPDSPEIQAVFELISRERGIAPDEICRKLDLKYREVSRATGQLELDGFISVDLLGRCAINAKIA